MIKTRTPVARTGPQDKMPAALAREPEALPDSAPVTSPFAVGEAQPAPQIPNNFCILPFVSAQVRANGSVSVCCLNTEAARDSAHDELYLYKSTFREALDSEYFTSLKKTFLAGERPKSCQRCFDDDDIGVRSRRKNENENHAHWIKPVLEGKAPSQPVVFDLNMGTLCNLKCRTCGPASSSKWVQESLDLFKEDHLPRDSKELKEMPVEESRKILLTWQDKSPDFYSSMKSWMPEAERLEFFGGEPMLSKHHLDLVRESVRSGASKKQILRYATNGTVVTDELMDDLWPKFREIHLNVSVDGLKKQFEYIRFGAKWDALLENINRYRKVPSISAVGINITVSIFNIYYLPEMYIFWEKSGLVKDKSMKSSFASHWKNLKAKVIPSAAQNVGLFARDLLINENNYVRNPERFDIRSMPLALKEKVKEKFARFRPRLHPDLQVELDSALAVMFSEDLSAYWPRFIESVWFHDGYRKQSFAEYFPEFHQLAVDAGLWYDYQTQPELFFTREQLAAIQH